MATSNDGEEGVTNTENGWCVMSIANQPMVINYREGGHPTNAHREREITIFLSEIAAQRFCDALNISYPGTFRVARIQRTTTTTVDVVIDPEVWPAPA
jgi:hypothetical protein